jgi:hypothetical protein
VHNPTITRTSMTARRQRVVRQWQHSAQSRSPKATTLLFVGGRLVGHMLLAQRTNLVVCCLKVAARVHFANIGA